MKQRDKAVTSEDAAALSIKKEVISWNTPDFTIYHIRCVYFGTIICKLSLLPLYPAL